MQSHKFLRHFSAVLLILSSIFLIDLVLPTVKRDATVISTHRPRTKRGFSREEVIIQTTEGRIKVRPNHLYGIFKGDSVIFYKSIIFGIGKSIYLKDKDRISKTSNLVYGWFLFMPVLILTLSIITVKLEDPKVIENIGGANVALTIFVLYILLRDYFR